MAKFPNVTINLTEDFTFSARGGGGLLSCQFGPEPYNAATFKYISSTSTGRAKINFQDGTVKRFKDSLDEVYTKMNRANAVKKTINGTFRGPRL